MGVSALLCEIYVIMLISYSSSTTFDVLCKFLINAFLNDCPYPVVYRIEVKSVGRPHVWCGVQSIVSQQLSALVYVVHWKVKVASSLTGVWQQLFEQQDVTVICTIHFRPWLHENDTSAAEPGDTD